MSWDTLIKRLVEQDDRVERGGGAARQARQARLGRKTPRERLAALLDVGSFVELSRHQIHKHSDLDSRLAATRPPGDGLICGLGQIEGAPVAVCAHDLTVLRGAVGEVGAHKLSRLLTVADERGLPVITVADRVRRATRVFLGTTVWGRTLAPASRTTPGSKITLCPTTTSSSIVTPCPSTQRMPKYTS